MGALELEVDFGGILIVAMVIGREVVAQTRETSNK
jgi:hypothetical protein